MNFDTSPLHVVRDDEPLAPAVFLDRCMMTIARVAIVIEDKFGAPGHSIRDPQINEALKMLLGFDLYQEQYVQNLRHQTRLIRVARDAYQALYFADEGARYAGDKALDCARGFLKGKYFVENDLVACPPQKECTHCAQQYCPPPEFLKNAARQSASLFANEEDTTPFITGFMEALSRHLNPDHCALANLDPAYQEGQRAYTQPLVSVANAGAGQVTTSASSPLHP